MFPSKLSSHPGERLGAEIDGTFSEHWTGEVTGGWSSFRRPKKALQTLGLVDDTLFISTLFRFTILIPLCFFFCIIFSKN